MKISHKVVLTVGISVGLMLLPFGALSIRITQDILMTQANRLLQITASDEESAMIGRFKSVKLLTQAIAKNKQLVEALSSHPSLDLTFVLNEQMQNYPYFNYIAVLNRKGNLFAATTTNRKGKTVPSVNFIGQSLRDPSLSGSIQKGITKFHYVNDAAQISTFGQTATMFSTLITTPIWKNGDIIGGLLIFYDWHTSMKQLMERVRRQFIAEGFDTLSAQLLTPEGQLIVSVGFQPEMSLYPESQKRVYREIPLVFDELKFRLRMSMEEGELFEPIRKFQTFFYIFLGLTIPSLIVLLVVTLRIVVLRKLRTLRAAAIRVSQGDLEYRINDRYDDDFDEITSTFNLMLDRLNRMIFELEESKSQLAIKVKDRTHELAMLNEHLQSEIIKQKQAEQRIKEQTLEMERSNKLLTESNAELQRFAYTVSHDLQEPLRMVSSYVQLLARRYQGTLDSDADDFIGFAIEGANRMKRMINDLLTYSRVGTSTKPRRPIDTEASLKQAIANLKLAAEESQAVITHDPLPTLQADEIQLVQLFQNLIGNAIKFRGPAKPQIHVSARKVEECQFSPSGPPVRNAGRSKSAEWLFSVRANGIGIAPKDAQGLFTVFHRLHDKEKYQGTGIGLAVCKRIVERHRGRIWVESQPGQGATFYFTLPSGHGEGQN